jgi:predicted nucleic acid-binding protein
MRVVVDASVVLKWLVAEEDSETALLVRVNHDIAAPDFLLIECRNALLTKFCRGKLQQMQAEKGQSALEEIAPSITIVPSLPVLRRAFALAFDLDEPIYDCIYLATALAMERKLITADVRLAAKAHRLRSADNPIVLLRSLPT